MCRARVTRGSSTSWLRRRLPAARRPRASGGLLARAGPARLPLTIPPSRCRPRRRRGAGLADVPDPDGSASFRTSSRAACADGRPKVGRARPARARYESSRGFGGAPRALVHHLPCGECDPAARPLADLRPLPEPTTFRASQSGQAPHKRSRSGRVGRRHRTFAEPRRAAPCTREIPRGDPRLAALRRPFSCRRSPPRVTTSSPPTRWRTARLALGYGPSCGRAPSTQRPLRAGGLEGSRDAGARGTCSSSPGS